MLSNQMTPSGSEITKFTLVGFLSCMQSHMFIQVMFSHKSFMAHITHEWPPVAVTPQMQNELIPWSVRFATHHADVMGEATIRLFLLIHVRLWVDQLGLLQISRVLLLVHIGV